MGLFYICVFRLPGMEIFIFRKLNKVFDESLNMVCNTSHASRNAKQGELIAAHLSRTRRIGLVKALRIIVGAG